MNEQDNAQGQDKEQGFKETFRSGSPDEVKERVKDTVAKGVAAVAGALKGFSQTAKEHDIAGTTKEAIGTAGETASQTAANVSEQAKKLKEPLKEAGQKLSETARDLSSTAKEQYRSTKDAVKGEGSTGGSAMGSSSLGGSSLGSDMVEDFGSSADMGRRGTGQGTEMPDISKTPMAASDRELKGKDLSEDLED